MIKRLTLLCLSLAILVSIITSHAFAQNRSEGARTRSSVSSTTNNQTTSNIQITNHVARVNGLNIHYLRAGQGDPLVLLHGWPQHSLMWRKIMPALAEHYTVIAPDLRGSGGSSIPVAGYDKRTMAQDVYGLVRQLGFERIFLVGYDHGAGVAYQYANAHPIEVRRLAILEYAMPGFGYEKAMQPSPDWDSGSNWQLAFFTVPDVAERFMMGQERELLSWFFWHISCNPSAVSQNDFEEYVRQISKPGALRAGINYYATVWRDMENHKESARRKLRMPVLAVGGECSGAAGIAQSMQPLATNVQGAVIEQAGHWLTDENPNALTRQLLTFFGEEQREPRP